jgi:hypothetical protein
VTAGGIGADADFGRGGGDPLGGPDAPGAGGPETPDFSAVLMQFKVRDRYYGTRTVHINWIDPQGEAEELLLRLWRLWHAGEVERINLAGGAKELGAW